MNFLAHSYLSYSDEQLVGNMIADFVRNREVKFLPEGIQVGIKLHREIDTFTDTNPIIHRAKRVFSPMVRLYAGAFVDVSFDYFLANDASLMSDEELKSHAQKVYKVLSKYQEFLPEQFKIVLERMKKDNWLYNYRYDWGVEYSFRNVVNKAKYLDKNIDVFPLFVKYKEFLREHYEWFFPEMMEKCSLYKKI
ncbi:MAG: ACP phosphodiesterase [Flavobacteriaceae bacterium]|nr:ACP phosphodiesterase [Flavobacteriaceae bacterium]